jgi:hypothetical protein
LIRNDFSPERTFDESWMKAKRQVGTEVRRHLVHIALLYISYYGPFRFLGNKPTSCRSFPFAEGQYCNNTAHHARSCRSSLRHSSLRHSSLLLAWIAAATAPSVQGWTKGRRAWADRLVVIAPCPHRHPPSAIRSPQPAGCSTARALTGSCPPPHQRRSWSSCHLHYCPFWCLRGIYPPLGTTPGVPGRELAAVREIAINPLDALGGHGLPRGTVAFLEQLPKQTRLIL